jgi:pyrimidine-specific ribonucleoside hydrolase
MIKVIMDCDPGHDDVFALLTLLAHPEKAEVLGFTTVVGNQTLAKVTDNLLRVLTLIQSEVPVSAGAEVHLNGMTYVQPGAHGDSGLDGAALPLSKRKVTGKHAVEWIYETLKTSSEKIVLIPTGPLTNIALLLQKYPEIKSKIAYITLMGGSVYRGNVTSQAEFNIWADPEAAKIVFESGLPITMSGLEVCHAASLLHEEVDLFKSEQPVSHMVYGLLGFFNAFAKKLNQPGSPMFDVCPVMHLLYPELFKGEPMKIDIEVNGTHTRGKTVADTRLWADPKEANATVLMDVDRPAFIQKFIEAVKIVDGRLV